MVSWQTWTGERAWGDRHSQEDGLGWCCTPAVIPGAAPPTPRLGRGRRITWYWSLKLHYNPRYKNVVVEQKPLVKYCQILAGKFQLLCSELLGCFYGRSLQQIVEDLVDGTGQTWSSGFLCLANYVWIQWIQWIWYVFTKKSFCMHTGFLSKTRCFPRHVTSHVRNQ